MFTCVCKSDFFLAIFLLILLTLIVALPFIFECGETDNPIVDEGEHDGEETCHAGEEEGEDEHEEEWRFEVVGLKAGTTGIILQFLHGDYPDFTAALPIPVTVQ